MEYLTFTISAGLAGFLNHQHHQQYVLTSVCVCVSMWLSLAAQSKWCGILWNLPSQNPSQALHQKEEVIERSDVNFFMLAPNTYLRYCKTYI